MCPLSRDTAADPTVITVGVLSDTHGHLYPQVSRLLQGVDHIIHAGDIGSPHVLTGLRAIAPVTAVRGNCDHYDWAATLPTEAEVEMAGVRILVGHIAGHLRETLARKPGFRVAVTGHTHRAASEERDSVLHLNPGSAGPERFGHPRTMALLHITPAAPQTQLAQAGAPAQVGVELLMVPEA
jgi:putative phosphoesterase